MCEKDKNSIAEIKEKVSNMSAEAIGIATDIMSLSEITYDYCAYNADFFNGNIMTVFEIIKEKCSNLINLVDTSAIEIYNSKSQ